VDEMGPLATIPRGGRSWGKQPARRSDRYHKSQTIQLLGAFAPHTGQGMGLPHACKTGEAVLAFLQNSVLPRYSTQGKIYLIWDNFSAHKKALSLWQPKPSNVEFHETENATLQRRLRAVWDGQFLSQISVHCVDVNESSVPLRQGGLQREHHYGKVVHTHLEVSDEPQRRNTDFSVRSLTRIPSDRGQRPETPLDANVLLGATL